MSLRSYPVQIRARLEFGYVACAAAALLLAPVVTSAQLVLASVKNERGADADALTITVMTFHSSEKGLGAKVAETLRERLTDDFSSRQLQTVSTGDVTTNLESSGFSIEEPLAPVDEQKFANLLRADLYVTGKIMHSSNDEYRLEAWLVLPRDLQLAQPLPPASGRDVDRVVEITSKSIREALKQLDAERKCTAAIAAGKLREAVAAAGTGVQAYSHGMLVRICMAKALTLQLSSATTRTDSVRYADSLLSVTQAILNLDSLNSVALQLQVGVVFRVHQDTALEHRTLLRLATTDSGNAELIERVVNSLAAGKWVRDAVPLVKNLLDRNPGTPHFLHLAFVVYVAAQDWQSVVEIGPELVKADSSAADSTYFFRMMTAYDELKQPSQALDVLAQGTAKLPNAAVLWAMYGKRLVEANQTQQAIDAFHRVIALNPPQPDVLRLAYGNLARLYDQANASDSLYTVIETAARLPQADTSLKSALAMFALKKGNDLFKGVSPPDSTASADAKAQFRVQLQPALKFLMLSNQTVPSVEAQFLIGAVHFQVMQSAAQEADTAKSCELARLAQQSYEAAQVGIQAGVKDEKLQAPARQMLEYMPQYTTAIETEVKDFCK